jgi:predicted 3-demethylubiquinone-9 3-methyltransferase (glyoxalase superfamily)
MTSHVQITPCLWFADEAEEAATFYTGLFANSRILRVSRYPREGHEIHGRPEGSVMTVDFELNGQRITALNGGPVFKLSEAISLQVFCQSQTEIDHYWETLSQGGDPAAQQCGWLKDRFGLSWQVVPANLADMMTHPEPARQNRVMKALLQMKKLDIAALGQAFAG